MTNEIWVTFLPGGTTPVGVFLSKETAKNTKFHSDELHHYVHIDCKSGTTREQQLIRANSLLQRQIEDLTHLLEKAE